MVALRVRAIGARRGLASGRLGAVDAAVGEGVRASVRPGRPRSARVFRWARSRLRDPGQWWAAAESERAGLGIRFLSVLPQLTPTTDLGAAGVAAYAARQGVAVSDYLESLGPLLTPDSAGQAIADLARDPAHDQGAYLLTASGLTPAP